MMRLSIQRVYRGPMCGDCVRFGQCRREIGVEAKDRPCWDFMPREGW